MGSFHIGGRIVEMTGKEVRMIQRQPGGPPAKLDPNGQYMVEQMYVQYFLPKNRKGKLPLLMWHGGGLTGVTYETTPDGREAGSIFHPQGLGRLQFGRGGARPLRLCDPRRLAGEPIVPDRTAIRSSASASATAQARGTPIRQSASCCPAPVSGRGL